MEIQSQSNSRMRLKRRLDLFPKCIPDAIITGFLMVMIPVIYFFEIFIVLPHFYTPMTLPHLFHVAIGTFILWNLCGNMMAIMVCDTSIRGLMLPSDLAKNWKFCSSCESITPPRAWHCEICGICILKRDHHCKFTSCCVGFLNQRYFMVFILYMFVATAYSTIYNFIFIADVINVETLGSLLKVVFPIASFFMFFTYKDFYMSATLLTTIGALFTAALLYYHVRLILMNKTTHERVGESLKYDRGWFDNFKDVFGERWYLVWISPYHASKLPQDGINWVTNETSKDK